MVDVDECSRRYIPLSPFLLTPMIPLDFAPSRNCSPVSGCTMVGREGADPERFYLATPSVESLI